MDAVLRLYHMIVSPCVTGHAKRRFGFILARKHFPCFSMRTTRYPFIGGGIVDYGIIAAETFDFEIIEKYIARTMIFRCLLLSAQTAASVVVSSEA